MDLPIIFGVVGSVVSVASLVTAFAAIKMALLQTQTQTLEHVNNQFNFPANVIAANPRIRPLFYDDDIARMVDTSEITALDLQVATIAAEAFLDAFESALMTDGVVRNQWGDDQFFGYFQDRMLRESAFLREFLLARPNQYHEALVKKAQEYHK